ncbi:MAG: glycosyltransferase family 4 protein [Deltaproteobacteria bacterium]|nr:glycosyltransferase family 4 protein [Deltaproteobacteria bacterium]
MRVVVAHPGTQHSLRLAVALQKADRLAAYVTRMYWDAKREPYRTLESLPVVGPRLAAQTVRRRHDELSPDLVVDESPTRELLLYGLARAHLPTLRRRTMLAMNRRFGRRVADLARREADALVTYDLAADDAFAALDGTGVRRILDLSHPHVQGHRILQEEAEREPAWAATLRFPTSPDQIESCRREERAADRVIVASSFSRECMIRDGVPGERVVVVPYGVDLERFRPEPVRDLTRRPLRALFVGQVGQRKGISYLLEAMRRLGSHPVELTIAGEVMGSAPGLREACSERVHLAGRVAERELARLFASADVFVLPSLVEGFGLVLLEAMAAGLPILATPHSAAPDLVEEGGDGFVVPVRDPDAIAERLALLASDPALLRRMKRAARAKAELFPWSRYERAVVEATCGGWDQTAAAPSRVAEPGRSLRGSAHEPGVEHRVH